MKPRFTLRPMAFALAATTVLGIDLASFAVVAAGHGKSFSAFLQGKLPGDYHEYKLTFPMGRMSAHRTVG
jgi:hypothetical protein